MAALIDALEVLVHHLGVHLGGGDIAVAHQLLQGVVDCALVEPDGITVVDFTPDYVTAATLPEVLARYPEARIIVDASLTASMDPGMHEKVLDVLEGFQVKVINR